MLGIGLSLTGLARGGSGSSSTPSLDLDFTSGTLDSRIAFSRTSQAWQTDSTGTIVAGPHNLLPNSQDFDASTWTKTASSVTGNAAVAPTGETTADRLTDDLTTAEHVMTSANVTWLSNTQYTLSIYAKAGTLNYIRLLFSTAGNWVNSSRSCFFDLSAGTVVGTPTAPLTATITSVGSGWYRCSITATTVANPAASSVNIALANTSSNTSWAGTGTSTLFLFGAQLAQSARLRNYISSSVKNLVGFTEALDNAYWSKGNSTATANDASVTAPFGGLTADKLVESATTASHYFGVGSTTTVVGTTYTLSCYARAAERSKIALALTVGGDGNAQFDLSSGTVTAGSPAFTSTSISAIGGTGWYRISGTYVATGTALTFQARIIDTGTGTFSSYAGNGTSGLHVWGVMLSSSGSVDAYFPNAGAAPSSAITYGARFDYAYQLPITNLLTYSEQFDNTAWTKSASTVTANATIDPLGTSLADKLVESATSAVHYIEQGTTATATVYMGSVYAKAGERTSITLYLVDSGGIVANTSSIFNLSTGVVTSGAQAAISTIGNGWYRLSVYGTSAAGSLKLRIILMNPGQTYLGDGASGCFVFGGQLEQASSVGTYVPTTMTQARIGGSTTNLLLQSQTFDHASWTKAETTVTADAAADPLGVMTADKILDTVNSAVHQVFQAVTFTSGTSYTFSFYAKGAERTLLAIACPANLGAGLTEFDLTAGTATRDATTITAGVTASITPVGNSWYRCALSGPATTTGSAAFGMRLRAVSGTSTYAGTGTSGLYLWGAQLEANGTMGTYAATTTIAASVLGTEAKGFLSEEARTNLTTNSVGTAIMAGIGTQILTPEQRAALAPDGTWTAVRYTAISTSNASSGYAPTTTASTAYTVSVYIKKESGTSAWFRIRVADGTTIRGGWFNATTGALGTVEAATSTFTALTFLTPVAVGNGWWRVAVAFTTTATTPTFAVAPATGDNTSTMAVGDIWQSWGLQLEAGTFPTSLIPTFPTWTARAGTATYYDSAGVLTTAASGAARYTYAYSGSAWISAGLMIEAAATNLFAGDLTNTTNWTAIGSVTRATGATAPDASTNGVTFTEPAGGTTSYGINSVTSTITASTATTASIFAKAGTASWVRLILGDATSATIAGQAWFNISTGVVGTSGVFAGAATNISATITNVGNGWYRCTITATLSTATTGFLLVRLTSADNVSTDIGSKTMVLFGPQIEVAAQASSYIPTTTASASRIADSSSTATVTRAADTTVIPVLGSWFNPVEGTAIVETECPYQTGFVNTGVSFGFADGTFNNVVYFSNNNTSDSFSVQSGGVQQAAISNSSPPLTAKKVAGVWKVNDFAACRNGGTVGTDTSGALPVAPSMIGIGKAPWGTSNPHNGWIRRIRLWTTRRANGELQILTL